MTKANMLMSLTATTLSLGFSVQPHPAPFWKASGTWDWINTKCLASIDLARPNKCNHRDGNAQDSGECRVKSAGHPKPIVSE